MGPSVAFQILVNSKLKEHFNLKYVDIKVNKSLDSIGKWSPGKVVANLKIYKEFYRSLKSGKPDLVLIPISQSTAGFIKDSVFILLAAFCKRKILIQLRGGNFRNWYDHSSSIVRSYVQLVLKKCEGVIVLGTNLKNLFSDFFPDNRIHVIPNGGNYSFPDIRRKPEHVTKLIYVGNLQHSKGIEDVLNAFQIFYTSENKNCTLDVIGQWRDQATRQTCHELVNNFKLPVTFHHNISVQEKLSMLKQSDIFLFTPRAPEGHPWVIIEAMAAGLPIISTDRGAIIESVKDGVNGFIVPASKPAAITEKIKLLVNDEGLRFEMGRKSRESYLQSFTEDIMIEKYIRTFTSVTG